MTADDFHLAYQAADALAAYVLRDIRDKHGRPLIEHCRRVEDKCRGLRYEQRVAAVLHDCGEDGGLDYKTVAQMFGPYVAMMVSVLTRKPSTSYEEYILQITHRSPLAVPIKLADLADNLDESRGPIPGELRKRYETAYERLMTWAREKDMELPAWAWERWHGR